MHILALSDAAICIGQRNYMRASGQIYEEFCLTSCPKHIVFMEELKEIYERMTFLRQKGVKMKDMAERAGFSPSVLSAIYSTVLPAYFKNREKGMSGEEALNNALVWGEQCIEKEIARFACPVERLFVLHGLSGKGGSGRRPMPVSCPVGEQYAGNDGAYFQLQRHLHQL